MANQDFSISSEGQAFNASGSTTLAVTSVTANVALPSTDPTVVVQNTGSVTAYVFIAAGSGTVATTANTPVLAGNTVVLSAGLTGTYLAAITASSTTSLTITTGNGIPLLLSGSTSSTIGTVTLGAGEAHIGAVGGAEVHLTSSPTVTAGAYTSGQVVGGLISLTGAARANSGSGFIQTAIVTVKTALTAPFDVLFFDTNPTNSTFTDNSNLAVNVADLPFLVGVAHCTDNTSLGTPQSFLATGLALPFKLSAAATTLYAVIVIRGAQTFASTSAVQLTVAVSQD